MPEKQRRGLKVSLDEALYQRIKANNLKVTEICRHFLPKVLELAKCQKNIIEGPSFDAELHKLLGISMTVQKELLH